MDGSTVERGWVVRMVLFVLMASLLWIGPSVAALDCALTVTPPEGQFAGEEFDVIGSGFEPLQDAQASLGLMVVMYRFQPFADGSFHIRVRVPTDLTPGDHTLAVVQGQSVCTAVYTVLSGLIAILPDPSTDATIPLDTIDTIAPTTTTTTSTTTTTTTTTLPPPPPPPTTTTITTPPPTTPGPTTAAPASTAPSTPVVPGASGSTTVAPTTTTVAVETTTTLAEPASTVSDTTLVAAAPQSDDGGTSSDQMLIGLVIGVGAAGLLVLAWALGRRGRTTPGSYQPPPPPPPR